MFENYDFHIFYLFTFVFYLSPYFHSMKKSVASILFILLTILLSEPAAANPQILNGANLVPNPGFEITDPVSGSPRDGNRFFPGRKSHRHLKWIMLWPIQENLLQWQHPKAAKAHLVSGVY